MSANFTGVTFAKQKVTPSYDGIVRRALLTDGTLTGCEMSYSGSTLTMSAGQLLLCGRQIVHPSSQNWAVTEQTSGYARLVLTIDLTRTSTKETFDQVVDTIQYATSVDGFAALEQTDINTTGTKYQVAACVVSLGTGGITGIVSKLEKCEGGGAGLNFKVVGGTTAPGSPTENTIWVKTAIDIPYWTTASSAKAPAYVAKKGTVTFWWESATSTEVSGTTAAGFMPIKYKATNPPGNMRLKPINCYQNQDGTKTGWERMEAYIYKSGEWVQFSMPWNGEIYDSGIFYFPFVKTDSNNYGGYTKTGKEGATKGSVTFGVSDIMMNVYEVPEGNNSIQFFGSDNPIDLSGWNTLKVEFSSLSVTKGGSTNEGNWVCVAASPEKAFPGTGSGAAYKRTYSESGAAIISVDISNLDAAYVVVTGREYASANQINAKVVKIWME